VGLYASWEFFDWGRKRKELGEKRAAMQQAQNTLHGTESNVMIDVNSRIRKVEETQVQLRVAQLSQETAREKLRVAMDKYSQKAALLQDVLQAQASLADANDSYQQAVLSFWTARADLEKALGEE
jgi:outer membrane protein